jgi:hypothetical protein
MAPRRLPALSQFSRKSLWYENVLENQGVGPAPCRATFPSSSPLTPGRQSESRDRHRRAGDRNDHLDRANHHDLRVTLFSGTRPIPEIRLPHSSSGHPNECPHQRRAKRHGHENECHGDVVYQDKTHFIQLRCVLTPFGRMSAPASMCDIAHDVPPSYGRLSLDSCNSGRPAGQCFAVIDEMGASGGYDNRRCAQYTF